MVSFISIAFFVLLGAAIFLGINWSVTGYKNTVNNTLEEWNMHDIEITFPYGFDQNEINKIKQLNYDLFNIDYKSLFNNKDNKN